MKNSIGSSVILSIFGESHGPYVGAVLDGMAPGIPVDSGLIASLLTKRRPKGLTESSRREKDDFQILSGVFNGMTTGAPISVIIPNHDIRSQDYDAIRCLARPSHADFSAHCKYGGFEDYRGGGHFSGRVTAPIVALGAIALKALECKNIHIATHILRCQNLQDREFSDFEADFKLLAQHQYPVLDEISDQIEDLILSARSQNDSVGGVTQTAIIGLEAGVGEPWFDSLDSALARALFSIGGVKGVEFGSGFRLAHMTGSVANDVFFNDAGSIRTRTNHSGGINGGISNGMPVIFNCAVKPTPSISLPQDTVNMETGREEVLQLTGRHDPAIVRRICIVVTCLSAIVLCDMLSLRHGTDFLRP